MHISESPRGIPASGPWIIRGIPELWTGARRVRDAAVRIEGDRVAWVGPDRDRPDTPTVFDGDGLLAMPGLVDCHTHAVFAGSRADDFRRRLAGESYAAILEAGGGIHSTVRATTAASEAELTGTARERLRTMARRGVTTVEVKSGYGLALEPELRMLRAARAAGEGGDVEVIPTWLAHVLPPGVERAAWVDALVHEHLDAVAPLVASVDVYCDRGAFTLDEALAILRAARARGLAVRAHAEQIEHTGVAAAAARMGALSVDHLERVDDDGIAAMAAQGTVAVLLPGAMVYLRDVPPPVARLRDAGVPLAVATDFNPGSSPIDDLWLAATLACLHMGLTVEEALGGITRSAALALGRPELGRIEPGARADLALYRPPPGEALDLGVLVQYAGGREATVRVRRGAVATV